jgi:hypothetical protein
MRLFRDKISPVPITHNVPVIVSQAWQLPRTESLHPLVHFMTSTVITDTMKDILCTHEGISELLSLMLNWLSVTAVEIHFKDYQNLG